MPRRFRIVALSVWPGLAQIWSGQEVLGLLLGVFFASAVNLAIVSRWIWIDAFATGLSDFLAVLAGFITAVWMRKKSAEGSLAAFAWPMTASLLCAPVVYPWYLLWLLPFLRSTSTVPIMVWTLSIIPTYYVWHLRMVGRPWLVPGWIMMLEYGSVAVAAAIIALRRITRSAPLPCSAERVE